MLTAVPSELLAALAAEAPVPVKPAPAAAAPVRQSADAGDDRRGDPVARCRAYFKKVPEPVSGQRGHDRTFQAARIIWNDFGIDAPDGLDLLKELNATWQDGWSDEDITRKWEQAVKAGSDDRGGKLREDRRPASGTSHQSVTHGANGHAAAVGRPGPPPQAEPAPPAAERFVFLDAPEFFGADFRPEWLVPRMLVRGQPAMLAGPSKGLKTSILVDLAVSLSSATPFLGAFPVPRRWRVALASGESGPQALQETAKRVAAARGVEGPDQALAGYLRTCFTLPTLSDLESVGAFEEALDRISADVVIIDPFYLCLGDVDEKSMFQMGGVLRAVSEIIQRSGRTVIIAHHANGRLQTGDPMGLEHLAYSGGAQFARQWMLVNRLKPYEPGGTHDIWLTVGGSVGHGGQWQVHVEEGTVDADFGGRRWDVSVQAATVARAEEKAGLPAKKKAEAKAKENADDQAVMTAIDAAAKAGGPAPHARLLRELTKLSHEKLSASLVRLRCAGLVRSTMADVLSGKTTKPTEVYHRAGD